MATNSKEIKRVDKGTVGYLPLLVPIALGLVAIASVEEILLPLAAIASIGWMWRRYQQHLQKKFALLNSVFYRVVQENQGRITVLDLAMKANLPGPEVQKYLHERAVEFSAHFEVTEQGGVLYYFDTAFSRGELRSHNQFASQPLCIEISSLDGGVNSSFRPHPFFFQLSLTQVELAKRLNVHPTTVSKWKTKPGFPEWSRDKDPEAIAWNYDTATKRFAPHPSDRHNN